MKKKTLITAEKNGFYSIPLMFCIRDTESCDLFFYLLRSLVRVEFVTQFSQLYTIFICVVNSQGLSLTAFIFQFALISFLRLCHAPWLLPVVLETTCVICIGLGSQ